MIITCPSCSARYNVADTAISAQGRKVKCAACGHHWLQMSSGEIKPADAATARARLQEQADAFNDAAVAKSPTAKTKPSKAARKGFVLPSFKFPGRKSKPVLAAHQLQRQKTHGRIKGGLRLAIATSWIVTIGLGAAGLIYSVMHRTEIVRAWPKSASAFSLIGFPANLYGVDIAGVQVASGVDTTGPRIVVSGVLHSVSRVTEAVPYMRVALVDKEGKEVLDWMVDPGITSLEPGQTHRFRTIRRNPPRGELTAVVAFGEPPRIVPRAPPEPPAGASGLMGAAEPDASLKAKVEGAHPVATGR